MSGASSSLGRSELRDCCGRRIDYLRLSVTDRCDLRCAYCRPASSGPRKKTGQPAPEMLDDDGILYLVGILAGMGIRRVRVTGGEPLIRPGIVELVARLCAVPGIEDLSMTTNGLGLEPLADALKSAGLRRVNISLDSLLPERFERITGVDGLCRVRRGIDAAIRTGLHPVKLNVVVLRGCNEDEVPHFAALTRDRDLHVRFIELMPLGDAGPSCGRRWVPLSEIRERCGVLESAASGLPAGGGPAVYSRLPGAQGTLGFIGALSEKFCAACNRLRLASDGRLLSCLAATGPEADIGSLIRSGAGRERIEAMVRVLVSRKGVSHGMHPTAGCVPDACMSSIGG